MRRETSAGLTYHLKKPEKKYQIKVEMLPQASKILKLDEAVVNRIAAGEIIQRPSNAVKELIENAIDAEASSIDLIVADGGLKLLQITDNGSGIPVEDMPILCERFTTSKIRQFDDLAGISTYGFRGEALASISHIARVTITSKTPQSSCAYRAVYAYGTLVASRPGATSEPQATAGNQGTQITIEGMFDNDPSRKRALSRPTEEYSRILDVVQRYAIHCAGVAFSCRKSGDKLTSISTARKNTIVDNIRLIHGSNVANELLSVEHHEPEIGLRFHGLLTSPNYHVKKFIHIIFINNRLVGSSSIRKTLENVYNRILPKDQHPFIYLSIHVEPARIDVNVHPTKREVTLLDEESILVSLSTKISERLCQGDRSRRFVTKTIAPVSGYEQVNASANLKQLSITKAPSPAFVRTDSKQQTLLGLLSRKSSRYEKPTIANNGTHITDICSLAKQRVSIQLDSVKELRADVKAAIHEDLTALFTEHVFVGIVSLTDRLCVIQHLTKLFLVDYGATSVELFYQIGLSEFGNFGTIVLRPALSIPALLKIAQEDKSQKEGPSHTLENDLSARAVDDAYQRLLHQRDMLAEYFALNITVSGELETIPLLLKDYQPSIAKLPRFLLSLCFRVNWTSEKECFHSFLKELALFYVPAVYRDIDKARLNRMTRSDDRLDLSQSSSATTLEESKLRSSIEDVLFPTVKKRLIATKNFATRKSVIEIGELNQLYKVFERC